MGRFGLRIRPFESYSHFLSFGKPPRIPNPTKILQNRPVLDLRTVTPSGEIPLLGPIGSRHLSLAGYMTNHSQLQKHTPQSLLAMQAKQEYKQ